MPAVRLAGDLDRPCAGVHAVEVKRRQPLGDEVDYPVGRSRADVVVAVEEDGGKWRPVHPCGRPATKQSLELCADLLVAGTRTSRSSVVRR